jgi:hypothetical protein
MQMVALIEEIKLFFLICKTLDSLASDRIVFDMTM